MDRFLSRHIRGLGPSATVAINERSDELRRQGRSIVKLGLGQSPFPVPAPVVEALRGNAAAKDYLPVRGLPALREAVADYHRRVTGVPYTPDSVIVAPGSKELMFLLQVVFDGELIVPTPAWVSYAPQAHLIGRRVTMLHAHAEHGWRLPPETLERHCKEEPAAGRVLILNYPSNPTGQTYTAADLERLAEVARRCHVLVLSDEIYGELHHQGEHVSIARFYPEGTIISSGLSKWCGAGGWRLGTFTAPPGLKWLTDAISVAASETYTSTSAPIQHAAVTAFRGGMQIERYLWRARRILAALGQAIVSRLRSAGVAVEAPVGAFYVFPDFAPHREALARAGVETSAELCRRLLEEADVAVLPGVDFGRPREELTLRIAYVDFDGGRAMTALEAMGDLTSGAVGEPFLAAHCASLLGGVDRIARWLDELGSRRER